MMRYFRESGLGAVLLALFLTVMSIIVQWDVLLDRYEDLDEKLAAGTLERDDYVELTADADNVLGNFAETKHRYGGIIPMGTDQHYAYLMPDGSLIVLSVSDKRLIEKLDAGERVRLKGRIYSVDREIKEFLVETLEDAGISADEVEIWDSSIDATSSRLKAFGMVGFFLALTVVCTVYWRKKSAEMETE